MKPHPNLMVRRRCLRYSLKEKCDTRVFLSVKDSHVSILIEKHSATVRFKIATTFSENF